MVLEIQLLERADLEAFVEADDRALKGFGYAQAMTADAAPGQTRKDMILGFMKQGFKQTDDTVWLKVVDTETGALVAGACWEFHLQGDGPQTAADAEEKEPEPKPGEKVSFMALSAKRGRAFRRKFVGSKPYAFFMLLFTDPKHQRRGAGSMLTKWGCDKADEYGVMSYLNASAIGRRLYERHGFQLVDEVEVDLRPWGVDETETRRGMIRPAKKA